MCTGPRDVAQGTYGRVVQGLVANSRESTRPDVSGTGVNHTGVCDERRVQAMVAVDCCFFSAAAPTRFSMVAFGASKA